MFLLTSVALFLKGKGLIILLLLRKLFIKCDPCMAIGVLWLSKLIWKRFNDRLNWNSIIDCLRDLGIHDHIVIVWHCISSLHEYFCGMGYALWNSIPLGALDRDTLFLPIYLLFVWRGFLTLSLWSKAFGRLWCSGVVLLFLICVL